MVYSPTSPPRTTPREPPPPPAPSIREQQPKRQPRSLRNHGTEKNETKPKKKKSLSGQIRKCGNGEAGELGGPCSERDGNRSPRRDGVGRDGSARWREWGRRGFAGARDPPPRSIASASASASPPLSTSSWLCWRLSVSVSPDEFRF